MSESPDSRLLDNEHHILHSIEVARRARARGNHPFGAILVGPDGKVLIEAENTVVTEHDRTGHAERNLMTRASRQFDDGFLARCTMYTSTEPCAMCAGATYAVGIGLVVYALSESALNRMIPQDPEDPLIDFKCRTVLGVGPRRIEVLGPAYEDEARLVHEGFWGPSPPFPTG